MVVEGATVCGRAIQSNLPQLLECGSKVERYEPTKDQGAGGSHSVWLCSSHSDIGHDQHKQLAGFQGK